MDYRSLLAIVIVLAAPAVIVLTIFSVLRKRREKLHRQRITKQRSKKHE